MNIQKQRGDKIREEVLFENKLIWNKLMQEEDTVKVLVDDITYALTEQPHVSSCGTTYEARACNMSAYLDALTLNKNAVPDTIMVYWTIIRQDCVSENDRCNWVDAWVVP